MANHASRAKRALKLAARIPGGFSCKEKCGKCCQTRVMMLQGEWAPIRDDLMQRTEHPDRQVFEITSQAPVEANMVGIVDERGWCPALSEDGTTCTVYDKRPLTCRVYGQHWLMYCGEGVPCPPEAEIPEELVLEWNGLLHQGTPLEYEPVRSPEALADRKRLTLLWRKVFNKRPDQTPTEEDAPALRDLAERLTQGGSSISAPRRQS